MAIKGFFFDIDGVVVDTERDGHRVAFNLAFNEFGYSFQWDVHTYHSLLQVAGGKERIRHYLRQSGVTKGMDNAEEDALVRALHKRKTEIFIGLIEDGGLPLRPGVWRVMHEINGLGLILGICTTSNEKAASTIVKRLLSGIKIDFVLAGDIVKRKKPDPEIYLIALEKTKLRAGDCVCVEDSRNGVEAAKFAGLNVLATTNEYTEREDLSSADIIVDGLGEPASRKVKLTYAKPGTVAEDYLTASWVVRYFEGA